MPKVKKTKCIILLSNKSSGSSACQNLLSNLANITHIKNTRHNENETLYWVKAASILGLPQENMIDSEVPIPAKKAYEDLIQLLRDNLQNYEESQTMHETIFNGWEQLCEAHGPIFFEKSPHHLYQWSALQLIIECMEKLNNIDFMLIGLVRNPMDTLYSAYSRWRTSPEKNQYEWLTSYQNLLKLKSVVGNKLVILKYEDLVSDISSIKPIIQFCEVDQRSVDASYMHNKSVSKWKNDPSFGFTLAKPVMELAKTYGYKTEDLTNHSYLLWPINRELRWVSYKAYWLLKKGKRRIMQQLKVSTSHG